jgi:hypothetical protein
MKLHRRKNVGYRPYNNSDLQTLNPILPKIPSTGGKECFIPHNLKARRGKGISVPIIFRYDNS